MLIDSWWRSLKAANKIATTIATHMEAARQLRALLVEHGMPTLRPQCGARFLMQDVARAPTSSRVARGDA
jgi:hypothetical protein